MQGWERGQEWREGQQPGLVRRKQQGLNRALVAGGSGEAGRPGLRPRGPVAEAGEIGGAEAEQGGKAGRQAGCGGDHQGRGEQGPAVGIAKGAEREEQEGAEGEESLGVVKRARFAGAGRSGDGGEGEGSDGARSYRLADFGRQRSRSNTGGGGTGGGGTGAGGSGRSGGDGGGGEDVNPNMKPPHAIILKILINYLQVWGMCGGELR